MQLYKLCCAVNLSAKLWKLYKPVESF